MKLRKISIRASKILDIVAAALIGGAATVSVAHAQTIYTLHDTDYELVLWDAIDGFADSADGAWSNGQIAATSSFEANGVTRAKTFVSEPDFIRDYMEPVHTDVGFGITDVPLFRADNGQTTDGEDIITAYTVTTDNPPTEILFYAGNLVDGAQDGPANGLKYVRWDWSAPDPGTVFEVINTSPSFQLIDGDGSDNLTWATWGSLNNMALGIVRITNPDGISGFSIASNRLSADGEPNHYTNPFQRADFNANALLVRLDPGLEIVKSAQPETFVVGELATYVLTVSNNGAGVAPEVVTISDVIPEELTLGELPDGCSAAGQNVTCTIAAGLEPSGQVSFEIPVTVAAAAVPSVTNTAIVAGGGDPACPDQPQCSSTVVTPVLGTSVSVSKSAVPDNASEVAPGDIITYTLTAVISDAQTTENLVFTDTLDASLTFDAVIDAGDFDCTGELECILPAGTLPGTYTVTYTGTVDDEATGTVSNSVIAEGGGGDDDPLCDPCDTEHILEETSPPETLPVPLGGPWLPWLLILMLGWVAVTRLRKAAR